MPIDHAALDQSLARLGDERLAELEPSDALHRIVSATEALFAVDGAGLMFVDDDEVLRYVAASDEPSRVLESAQDEMGIGPCVDALIFGVVVSTPDLERDERWPGLSERVVPAGIRAVLGVPVSLAGGPVGSLNVYSREAHEWSGIEQEALHAFSDLVAQIVVAWVFQRRQGEVVEQLQRALDHRVVIERAVGVIMGRDGLDAVQAFNQLRMSARADRRKVIDVAAELVGGA